MEGARAEKCLCGRDGTVPENPLSQAGSSVLHLLGAAPLANFFHQLAAEDFMPKPGVRCHINRYNALNQVGLIALSCLGEADPRVARVSVLVFIKHSIRNFGRLVMNF